MMPRNRWMMMALIGCGVAIAGSRAMADLDICGCLNSPKSLGALDTIARSGFPPGTVDSFRQIVLPVPDDGVLVFNSVNLAVRPEEGCCLNIVLARNQANTPITILASGDVTIGSSVTLIVSGDAGTNGSAGAAGVGGIGGPGGFRGGDGAYQQANATVDGGAGLGPTGGGPGLASGPSRAGDGTFFGLNELLPIVGGAGGGGGASYSNQIGCAAGGGGGGGGAILIASNGSITVNGVIVADGGGAGIESNGSCATRAGAGSGGALRLVAKTIGGTGALFARGGTVDCCTRTGGPGKIRMEAVTNTFPPNNTDPPASRVAAPGPLANPFSPTVAVTGVGGVAVTSPATGNIGGIDVFVPVPGPTEIDVATSGVPSGTTVQVTVKPRVGASVVSVTTALTNCDAAGNCIAAVIPNLPSGTYVVEARATFQTP